MVWITWLNTLKLVASVGLLLARTLVHAAWSRLGIPQQAMLPTSHPVLDPHQLSGSVSLIKHTPELSGLKSILATAGFTSSREVSYAAFIVSIVIVLMSSINSYVSMVEQVYPTYISNRYASPVSPSYLRPYTLGFTSILWSGHLMHVSIPGTYGTNPTLSSLSLTGGISNTETSVPLGDVCHHHLALGIVLLLFGTLYHNSFVYSRLLFMLSNLLSLTTPSCKVFIINSNMKLSLTLLGLSLLSGLASQQLSTVPSYPNITSQYVSITTLYVHHIWISCLLFLGSVTHLGIEFSTNGGTYNLLRTLSSHKYSILSTLSWISLFLGFHTLAIYVHNDTLLSFGVPSKQIAIEPFWVQLLQGCSGKLSPTCLSTYTPWSTNGFSTCLLSMGPGDLLSHHGISLGLHTSQLILSKSVLDTSGTSLLPDKYNLSYGYSCDGPGRSGTCDISGWDGFYLATFWILNLGGWITFYYHWKHLSIWQGTPSLFDEGSTYLNGYFRDYLWFNSGPLIKGYDCISTTDLSVAA